MADAHLLQQLLVQIHSQKLSDEKTIKSLSTERQSLGSELTATQSELEALDQRAAELTRQIANLNQSVTTETFSLEDFTSAVVDPLKERCEKLEVKVCASLDTCMLPPAISTSKVSRAVTKNGVGSLGSNALRGLFALPLPFTERVMRRLVDSLGSQNAGLESTAQKPFSIPDSTCTGGTQPIACLPPCGGKGDPSNQIRKFIGRRASELTSRDELFELYEAALSLARLQNDSSLTLENEGGVASSCFSSEYWCSADGRFTLEENAVNQTQRSAYCQSCELCVIAAVEDRIESLNRQTQCDRRMHTSISGTSDCISRHVEGDGKAFSIPVNGQVDSPELSCALPPPCHFVHSEASCYPNEYGLAFSRARKSITPILANAAAPKSSHRPPRSGVTIYNPYLGHKRPQSQSQPEEDSEEFNYNYDASSVVGRRGIVSSHNESQNSTERGLGNAKKTADGRQSRGPRQNALEIAKAKHDGRKQTNNKQLSSLSSFFVSDEFDDAFVQARIDGMRALGEDCDEGQRSRLDEHSDQHRYNRVPREVNDRHNMNTVFSFQGPACVLNTQLPPKHTTRAGHAREHDPIVTAVSALPPHCNRGGERGDSGDSFVGRGQHALLFDSKKDGCREQIVSAPSAAAFPPQMSASTQIRSAFAPRGRAKKTTLQFGR